MVEFALNWQGGITPAVGTLIAYTPSANDDNNLDGVRDTYITSSSGEYWATTTVLDTIKLAAAPAASSGSSTGNDYSVILYCVAVLIVAAVIFFLIRRRSLAKKA